MSQNRIRQINEEIRRELSRLIPALKDPRISGLVSVVRVDTAGDLGVSKIYVSALEGTKEVAKGLDSAAGHLRTELGRALGLRHIPKLVFIADDSIAQGVHVLDIMKKLGEKPE